jgi:hypothetical protein
VQSQKDPRLVVNLGCPQVLHILLTATQDVGSAVILTGGVGNPEVELSKLLGPSDLSRVEYLRGHEVLERPMVRKDFDLGPDRG